MMCIEFLCAMLHNFQKGNIVCMDAPWFLQHIVGLFRERTFQCTERILLMTLFLFYYYI